MSVKIVVRKQLENQVDKTSNTVTSNIHMPPNGWIATMRKALGMSGAQLGRRMGLSRMRISQAEKAEPKGAITLKSMDEFARAMGGKFVYAIVPESGTINDIRHRQARAKAETLIKTAATHMALEDQSLSKEQNEAEIERLAEELLKNPPPDFWEAK
ncbi:MAG: mobile mystery protein A [Alphaproteobacteria bacterium]|nr:MAG: mobile mystery protein A [Alphaproteobacteria bacterium]